MFLRRHRAGPGRAKHYWALVRSVREGSRVRQETIAYLGNLDAKGVKRANSVVAKIFGKKASEASGLFDGQSEDAEVDVSTILLKSIRVERCREFGGVWLGLKLWDALQLNEFCRRGMDLNLLAPH